MSEEVKKDVITFSLSEAIAIFQDGYARGFKQKKVDINKYFIKQWDVDILNKKLINNAKETNT